MIRLGAHIPKVICAIGLVPSAAVLGLITFDIIGLMRSDGAPLLAASAVTPVALVAFAWAVACAVVAFVAMRLSVAQDDPLAAIAEDTPLAPSDPEPSEPSASERHDRD